jgi:Secretion system C-terminal sorting domain
MSCHKSATLKHSPNNQPSSHLDSKLKNYTTLSKALLLAPLKNPKYTLTLGAAFLSGLSATHAGIIYSGVQNVSCALAGNSNRCYANINNAGGNDFEMHRNHVGAQVFIQVDEVPGGGFEINGFHAQFVGGYAYPYANAAGVVIGPAVPWGFNAGQANSLSDNGFYPNHKWEALANGTTRFIGIRGLVGGQTRYGWMRLTKNSFGNYTIVDWAYETTGASITTGVTLGTLPVEMVSFSVKEMNKSAVLSWATESEQNNAGFDIEKSEDGISFRTIGWVPGKGNSASRQEYLYDDKNIRSGKTFYYRLRQVDIDGRFKYSSIDQLTIANDGSMAGDFYPNPTSNGKVVLDFSAIENGSLQVEVFDASGKQHKQLKVAVTKGNNSLNFNFSGLAAGTYYVKMEGTSGRIYRTLVIL